MTIDERTSLPDANGANAANAGPSTTDVRGHRAPGEGASAANAVLALPVTLDRALCTDCGKCMDACPTDVFQVDAVTQHVEVRFPRDCHVCFLCVPDCAPGAITIDPDAPNPRLRSIYDILNVAHPLFK